MFEKRIDSLLNILAMGIVWASGGELVGRAVGGFHGALIGAVTGGAAGIANEIASQNARKRKSKDTPLC